MQAQLALLLPEIAVSLIVIFFTCISAFVSDKNINKLFLLKAFAVAVTICYGFANPYHGSGFGGNIVSNSFTSIIKPTILALSLLNMVIYYNYTLISEKKVKVEFAAFILLSTIASMIAISARSFLLLFCALELQSICAYSLTAFDKKNKSSTIAGVKYFILGAVMSAVGLFGTSFIYGFGAGIELEEVFFSFPLDHAQANIGLQLGMILFLVNIFFKLSLAPFHIWISDIYKGAPITVLTFFVASQMIALVIVLINIVSGIGGSYKILINDVMTYLALFSMFVGAAAGLVQKSLKRLMAYSFILNMGFTTMAIAASSPQSAIFYAFIYAISSILFLTSIISLHGEKSENADFASLIGVGANRKAVAVAISISCLSMIGVPPFAGFFAKYNIFLDVIGNNVMGNKKYVLAISGIIASAISAAYYLKIIKYVYFMQSPNQALEDQLPEYKPSKKGLIWISTIISLSLVLASFLPMDFLSKIMDGSI